METQINLLGVQKTYATPAGKIDALKEINLQIAPGEFVGVIGKSGAGKSTLINVITGVTKLTQGEIWVGGAAVRVPPFVRRGRPGERR